MRRTVREKKTSAPFAVCAPRIARAVVVLKGRVDLPTMHIHFIRLILAHQASHLEHMFIRGFGVRHITHGSRKCRAPSAKYAIIRKICLCPVGDGVGPIDREFLFPFFVTPDRDRVRLCCLL